MAPTLALQHHSGSMSSRLDNPVRPLSSGVIQSSAKSKPLSKTPSGNPIANFGFAFDIDGVLLRGSTPVPGATETLQYLHDKEIPFILLTNGGGVSEKDRVAHLSERLNVPLTLDNLVMSHTPFTTLESYKDKTVLVMGGDSGKVRDIAHSYGFKNVLVPGDLHRHARESWPFNGKIDQTVYTPDVHVDELPKPVWAPGKDLSSSLKIDAMFVFNDPRDWAYDIQLITDLLLSHKGYVGTYSSKNGDKSLPNNGYLQDGQPPLFFSNQDLFWSTGYRLPRLGQGSFQAALWGVWASVTGPGAAPLSEYSTIFGKPQAATYLFAEDVMHHYRKMVIGEQGDRDNVFHRVYMIGDNPKSDIEGANKFAASGKSKVDWPSMLVETGVYCAKRDGKTPCAVPSEGIYKDVTEAVRHALRRETEEARAEGKTWADF